MVTDFRKGTYCIGEIALSWENFVSIYFELKRLEIKMHKSFTSVVHCGVGISCDFIDLVWFSLKRHTSFRMWILVWVVFWDRKRELSPHKRIPQQAKREALPCLPVARLCSRAPHPPLRAHGRSVTRLLMAGRSSLVWLSSLWGLAVPLSEECVVFHFRPPRGRPHSEPLPFRFSHAGFSCQKNFSNAWKSQFHLQRT